MTVIHSTVLIVLKQYSLSSLISSVSSDFSQNLAGSRRGRFEQVKGMIEQVKVLIFLQSLGFFFIFSFTESSRFSLWRDSSKWRWCSSNPRYLVNWTFMNFWFEFCLGDFKILRMIQNEVIWRLFWVVMSQLSLGFVSRKRDKGETFTM